MEPKTKLKLGGTIPFGHNLNPGDYVQVKGTIPLDTGTEYVMEMVHAPAWLQEMIRVKRLNDSGALAAMSEKDKEALKKQFEAAMNTKV